MVLVSNLDLYKGEWVLGIISAERPEYDVGHLFTFQEKHPRNNTIIYTGEKLFVFNPLEKYLDQILPGNIQIFLPRTDHNNKPFFPASYSDIYTGHEQIASAVKNHPSLKYHHRFILEKISQLPQSNLDRSKTRKLKPLSLR